MEEFNDKPSIFGSNMKPKIRTTSTMFMNSDTLFVEYSDVIRNIDFAALYIISKLPNQFKDLFDLSSIYNLSDLALWEWYQTRKHKNILFELLPEEKKGVITNENLEKTLNEIILAIDDKGIRMAPNLQFAHVIKRLEDSPDIVREIKIWYPYENEVVMNDVKKTYEKSHIKFVSGPIDEALKDIGNNTTYVFSDMTNILVLDELEKLNYSSVIVAGGYRYNENNGEPKVNVESLQEDNMFKFNMFNPFE